MQRPPAPRALGQALRACTLCLLLPAAHAADERSAPTVRRLSDATLDCPALAREATALQDRIGTLQAEGAVLQQRLSRVQAGMLDDLPSVGGGSALAGALLGFVPGGDLIASVGAAASAERQQRQAMDAARELQVLSEQLAALEIQSDNARQRHDHLVGLYLARPCNTP